MALIPVGVDFAGAQTAADAQRNPAPAGVYELQVVAVVENDENGVPIRSKKGKPMFYAELEIVNAADPAINGKKMRNYVVLPTAGDLSAVGFLVDFAKACGRPWSGAEVDPQSFQGAILRANVGVTAVSEEDKAAGKTGFNNIDSYL